MILSLIVAVAANGVIGADNRLPWHIAEDLRHFKRVTLGKAVIMGRKTYESIGRPLPGRQNIVVSRDPAWRADGVASATSLDDALAVASGDEAVVIGGASLFAEALTRADRFHLTEIHRAYDGDVHFPVWRRQDWREISRRRLEGDPPVSFVELERNQDGDSG
jgi:dihydrofolate reductase